MDLTELNFWKRGGWEPGYRHAGTLPAPPVLFNLDKRALLDRFISDQPAERRFSIRWFRSAGVCQVGWGIYKQERKHLTKNKMTRKLALDHAKASANRAATEVRRSLLSICADRMLTLTYAENMMDRKQALSDLMKFIRVMRRECPWWQSVSVLEYQKRGACHFHIGLSGFYDINIIRRTWESIVGRGAVNMAFEPRGRGNSCSKLAGYMAKYLAKDLDEGRNPGDHRYFKTEGTHEGRREVFFVPNSAPQGYEQDWAVDVLKSLLTPKGGFPQNLWIAPVGIGGSGYASAEVPS